MVAVRIRPRGCVILLVTDGACTAATCAMTETRSRSHGTNFEAFRFVMADEARWKLSSSEQALLRARTGMLQREILYHASRRGIAAYQSAARLLRLSVSALTAIDAIRAAVHIVRVMYSATA